MTEPRSSARDSSLQDRKAPENCLLRTRQPRLRNVVRKAGERQSPAHPDGKHGELTERHAAVADRLIELLGDAFDALGGGAKRCRYRGLSSLVAI